MEAQSADTPNGGAWAAVLGSGIGCATIGLLTDFAEASKSFSARLSLVKPVGDLSGKTTFGVAVWLIAWALLHWRWRKRDVAAPGRVAALTVALVLIALIAVFPPFMDQWARD